MRTLFAGLAAFAFTLAATPASAMPASDPIAQKLMQGYYGNTRICREDHWFECHMWLYPDGTYILFGYQSPEVQGDPRHGFHVFKGTWTIEGTPRNYKLCRAQEDLAKPLCLPEPERPDMTGADGQHVGDVFWKFHDSGSLKGTIEHYFMAKGHI
jgi:hypothetical protein